MFTVALTGGVASGKSEVARRFAERGVDVIDADIVARELVEPGMPSLAAIVARFGGNLLDTHGALDRRALRERIFADAAARVALESILHPRIRETLRERACAAKSAYVMLAIPLLVESIEAYRWVDRVLVVDVARDVQIVRLTARDGVDRVLAEAMLAAQSTREQRRALADDVIDNSGPIASLDGAVEALHRGYLLQAAAKP